jgi:hypothetical protein
MQDWYGKTAEKKHEQTESLTNFMEELDLQLPQI